MKTLKPVSLALLFSLAFFTSCLTEDDASIDPPVEETLQANSTVADLMSRTSFNDGSNDNIIDNASCFNVQLPVTVIANGTEVIVDSASDYQTIEDIFDADNNDTDTLEIVFPITVTFEDYTTAEVNSYPELLALIAQCPDENSDDDDIECIDFQYPITASIFNQNNELIDTIVINSDYDMHEFIEDLDDYAAVTISFPITVILADGTTMTINSISELQTVIADADDSCDEDDDNDYNDDDCDNCTTGDIEAIFASCMNWYVDEFEVNDNHIEDQYNGYIFNFESDGTITITENNNTITGTWSASGSGNNIDFVIDIPSLPDFNGTWNLHEIEQESGEAEFELEMSNSELEFKSNCNGSTSGDALSEALTATNSIWFVSNYTDDGNDETSDFNGFEFTFNTSGTVSAVNNGTTITGTWSSQDNATELLLDFGTNMPLDELNDDWDVVSISSTQIELQDVSGGSGSTDTLTLQKL
tara:strand:+ start:35805 stop:37226 length:1422 start_codon:yes stop_codon:yes gene_type:complete